MYEWEGARLIGTVMWDGSKVENDVELFNEDNWKVRVSVAWCGKAYYEMRLGVDGSERNASFQSATML